MSFLRTQDDLRPDAGPVHMVQWDDDSYSRDLTDGFEEVLRAETPAPALLTNPERIASSVGSFLAPNRFEAEVAGQVVQDLEHSPGAEPLTADRRGLDEALRDVEGAGDRPRRPLLVVTGQSAPSRRFLRELARTAPAQARRLVVATGDAVAFNTVYRDRRVAWPIQDLPFALVFFCHFDPIHNNPDDPDLAFLPEGRPPPDGEKDFNLSATGTEDVLLNGAIIESLAQAFDRDDKPAADAGELSRRLAEITPPAWPVRLRPRRHAAVRRRRQPPRQGRRDTSSISDPASRATACCRRRRSRSGCRGKAFPAPSAPGSCTASRCRSPTSRPRRKGGRDHDAPPSPGRALGGYVQALTIPALLWALVAFLLWEPVHNWVEGEDSYDKSALEEWLDEARSFRKTLPEMAADYAQSRQELQRLPPPPAHPAAFDPQVGQRAQVERAVAVQGEQIHEHLRALGEPADQDVQRPAAAVPDHLPHRSRVRRPLHGADRLGLRTALPEDGGAAAAADPLPSAPASVRVFYQLHAFNKRQRLEQEHQQRLQQLSVLAADRHGAGRRCGSCWCGGASGSATLVQQQVDMAERKLLEEGAAPRGDGAQAAGAAPGHAGGRAAGAGAEIAAVRQHRHHGRLLRPQHQEPAGPAQRSAAPLPGGGRPVAATRSRCCTRCGRRSAP